MPAGSLPGYFRQSSVKAHQLRAPQALVMVVDVAPHDRPGVVTETLLSAPLQPHPPNVLAPPRNKYFEPAMPTPVLVLALTCAGRVHQHRDATLRRWQRQQGHSPVGAARHTADAVTVAQRQRYLATTAPRQWRHAEQAPPRVRPDGRARRRQLRSQPGKVTEE